jgi:hypothetical protein
VLELIEACEIFQIVSVTALETVRCDFLSLCAGKNSLAAVFLHIVESSLIELEWGLGKLKAMLTLGYGSSMVDEDQPADERTQRLYLEAGS